MSRYLIKFLMEVAWSFKFQFVRECRLHASKNPNLSAIVKVVREVSPKHKTWNRWVETSAILQTQQPKFHCFFEQIWIIQSRRYYSGFWSRGKWFMRKSPDRGPRRVCRPTLWWKVWEVCDAHHYQEDNSMVFSRMRFSCQKPRMLWVFLAFKRYNKNPGFLDFGF